jgi:bifunctional enzyme CysN/CysC/sulfate adenylyltransferase subunit 1
MTQGAVSKIHHRVDVNTMEQHPASEVKLNEIALCELTLTKQMSFDAYKDNRATGAFIIIDRLTNVTVGAGMVVGEAQDGDGDTTLVSAADKAKRFGQQPAIIAINGTNPDVIAQALDRRLFEMGKVAAIVSNENANVLKDAGLIALVAGGADDASISLAADEDSLDSMIANLQEKGII